MDEKQEPIKYDVTLTVRLPAELLDQTRAKSQETGIPIAHVVRKALEDWVEDWVEEGNHASSRS